MLLIQQGDVLEAIVSARLFIYRWRDNFLKKIKKALSNVQVDDGVYPSIKLRVNKA